MAKFRFLKNTLIGGEISPTAFGRTDVPQYAGSCKTLRNMIPILSGGAYRRPGTIFAKQYNFADIHPPRLFEFIYSQDEAYCVVVSQTTAYPGSGFCKPIRQVAFGTISEGTLSTGAPPWTQSLSNTPEWMEVQTAQVGDLMWMVHPNQRPQILARTAIDTFTMTDARTVTGAGALRDARPYFPQNTTAITLTPSALTGSITITASAAFFDAGHVGAYFKINHAGTIGVAQIATVAVGGLTATASVIVAFGNTTASLLWWEEAWSDYRGWPRTVTFWNNRIIYGGTKTNPDTLWFSETGDYRQLSHATIVDPFEDPTGTEAFSVRLLSQQVNVIQWLSPSNILLIGTAADEHTVEIQDPSVGVAQGNISTKVQARYGSEYRQAIRAGGEILFQCRTDNGERGLVYNDVEKSYVADPLQVFYDEYPRTAQVPLAYNKRETTTRSWDPTRSTLWSTDASGNLVSMTRDRKLGVLAWASHQMGGYDSTETSETVTATVYSGYPSPPGYPSYNNCSGSVISVCVTPGIFKDNVWVCVKRKIDGAFRWHIEYMTGRFPYQDSSRMTGQTALWIGSGVMTDATAVNSSTGASPTYTFTNLAHLEGKTPTGVGKNNHGYAKITGSAVSGGNTTLQTTYPGGYTSDDYTGVLFGLGFSSIVEPVRLEDGSQIGSAQGATKKTHLAFVRFYKTTAGKAGKDATNLETLVFRLPEDLPSQMPEFFNGDKKVYPDTDYDRDGYLYILQDEPLPFGVLAIIYEGMTYD